MGEENCSECKNGLVFGEKNKCIYCELTQRTGDKSCPKCSKSVLRDKSSLYCELCKCFYHNACNEFPLDDQYCTLLYEVPRNVKWFCDKCVWDTEKWISNYSVNNSSYSKTVLTDSANLVINDMLDKENVDKFSNDSCNNVPENDNLVANNKLDQDKPDDLSKKINKSNPKLNLHKNRKRKSGNKTFKKTTPSLKTRTSTRKVKCKVEISHVKEEIKEKDEIKEMDFNDMSLPVTDWDDTNYESSLEADDDRDADYHAWESDPKLDNKKKGNLKKVIPQKYQCDQCPKSFVQKRSFESHKMEHIDGPCICNICGKGVKKHYLESHIKKIHTDEKPFTCSEPDCNFSSRTKRKLKTHFFKCHRVLETLQCTLCEYQTKDKIYLKKHIKAHTGDIELFMCEECGSNFKSLHSLQYHQLAHSGEKPFKCEFCEKSFRSTRHLKVHQFVHTKEKNAFCPVCGKGFPTKDKLDVHLKTVHTNEKPFECEICGNTYKTKHNLKNHQSGKRGTCHPMNFVKKKPISHQKLKSSSESNMSDSNDSYIVPNSQPNQQPPILFYAGDVEKSIAPVYSNSHITATIQYPPQQLSVINYMNH